MSDGAQTLLIKAEALEQEAQRMEDFGHPHEWSERLRNRAQYLRAQADDAPLPAAPAGDGGLREALEALKRYCSGYVDGDGSEDEQLAYDDIHIQLSQILQKHPAAPAVPQPADERPLRAALERYFSNGGPDTPIRTRWHDGVEHWEAPAEDIRELIEGSAVPRPVDREALREQVEQALSAIGGMSGQHGVDHSYDGTCPLCKADVPKIADAVLAVLAGEQEQARG